MSEEKFGPFCLNKEMEEKRLKGIANVEKYLALEGPDRNVQRMEISTEDNYISLPFGGSPDPRHPFKRVSDTKLKAERRKAGKQEIFPDWSIHDGKIYSTPNPDLILVECDGRGRMFDPRFEEPDYYCNHYILKITLVDGLIHEVAEIFNPFECFRNTGVNDPPKIL
ncbi:MAG: PhzA/PhzB family protein [Deltaproteobacteria bacterium]|nr:MAG: PhzA/PhzB family protein [Deltaproteobacteria bacterium]